MERIKIMSNKKLLTAVSLLLGAVTMASEPVLPFLPQKPVIDGKVADDEWQSAEKKLLIKTGDRSAADKTMVYFGRDEQNFYAAFICYDKNPAKIKCQWRTPEERDNAVWSDDCVELRFDPWNSPKETFIQRHIIVNANAVVYDAIGRNPLHDFNITANAIIGKDFWSVELAIPLNDLLNCKSHGVELWRINLARTNPRQKEVYSLTGSNVANLAHAEHFLTYRSGKIDQTKPFTIVGFRNGELIWRSEQAGKILSGTLEQLSQDYRPSGSKAVSVLNQKKPQGTIKLKLNAQSRILRFNAPGNCLLEWNIPQKQTRTDPVKFTEKPLYKELWSNEPIGKAKDGSMTWHHGFNPGFLPIAFEFGIPWEETEALQTAVRYRLLLHGIADSMFKSTSYNWQNKTPAGTKFIADGQRFTSPKRIPKAAKDGKPLLMDPEVKKSFLAYAAKLKQYKKQLYAITFGDEVIDHQLWRFFDLQAKHKGKNTYPELDKISQEIRNKYGFGKFGPPQSPADTNVFRWIALRSYLAGKCIELHKEFKQIVNKTMPGVYVISDDTMASPGVFYDYTLLDESCCDILNAQLYPDSSEAVADFSFTSKYIRDLSPVKRLQPCFHIENYGAALTPLEMLEKVSQGFRGGANGFHWYLADTRGGRSRRSLGMERYGSPERWQLLTALQDEITRLPPLKFPEADCGFFVPATTLRAYPGMRLKPRKNQMLHSLLELQAGAWFKYFNERSLSEKLVDINKYKAVFVADAKYCSPESLHALVEYVKNGGTLVIADPEAFSFDAAGNALNRHQLPGLSGSKRKQPDKALYGKGETLPLFRTPCFELPQTAGSEVLLRYKDGRIAAQKTSLGKGKVIVFGAAFPERTLISLPEWQKYFRDLVADLGIKLDQDIWRFRFPDTLIKELPKVSGKCISGNHLSFRNFRADHSANEKVSNQAVYRCTPAADAPAEISPVQLRRGKLFDRRRAFAQGNADNRKATLCDRVAGWSTAGPITIEIDLKKPAILNRVELFYTGILRDVTVSVSSNGKQYTQVGFFSAGQAYFIKYGLRQKTLQLTENAPQASFIKLEFAASPLPGAIEKGELSKFYCKALLQKLPWQKANFMLSEVELFSK